MERILGRIVADDELHMRWLATLSHLENCGARKIVAFEPAKDVPLEVLRHAAEETRHAFFFKRLINKIAPVPPVSLPLLGKHIGQRYLHLLDVRICRHLKGKGAVEDRGQLKWGSYLLTTYAIEKRAESLYPMYEAVLRRVGKPLSLLSVIREERNHLKQIERDLEERPYLRGMGEHALGLEEELFAAFKAQLSQEVGLGLHV